MQTTQPDTGWAFSKTVVINAPVAELWNNLTDLGLMKKWVSELDIAIATDWSVGKSIVMRGQLYKKPFENSGIVTIFDVGQHLQYTQLSSLSRLPDVPESYSVIDFCLVPTGEQTALTITLSNFPTEAIYRHLAFYWNVTIELIKKQVEGR